MIFLIFIPFFLFIISAIFHDSRYEFQNLNEQQSQEAIMSIHGHEVLQMMGRTSYIKSSLLKLSKISLVQMQSFILALSLT
ncbi:hypothetical protein A9G23_01075 [Gilliamella sp. App4-10]|nr:hypothetical protein A9G23_01075 [Gilliamella apicola]